MPKTVVFLLLFFLRHVTLFQGHGLDLESHGFMLCSYNMACYKINSASFATTHSSNALHLLEMLLVPLPGPPTESFLALSLTQSKLLSITPGI